MKAIVLTNGMTALVDEADYDALACYSWRALKTPRNTTFYATRMQGPKGDRRIVYMHRQILGLTQRSQQTDHTNHDGLDNRRANLRVCTSRQNNANQRKRPGSRSAFKGVRFDRNRNSFKRWRAEIRINGKQTHLGIFSTELEAAAAYQAAAKEEFGSFACFDHREHSSEHGN